MKEQTICFTGHRNVREDEREIKEKIKAMIEYYILRGCIYFAAGGARGFDTLAAEAVLEIRDKYPQVELILILPFKKPYAVEKGWTEKDIERYESLLKQASETIYVGETYKRGCYFKRNRLLVRMSSICFSYQIKSTGGTAYTVRYADEVENIPVINVAEAMGRKKRKSGI